MDKCTRAATLAYRTTAKAVLLNPNYSARKLSGEFLKNPSCKSFKVRFWKLHKKSPFLICIFRFISIAHTTHNRHTPVCHRTTIWKNARFKKNLHAHNSSSILYTVSEHSNNVILSSATVHTTTHILHTPFAHYSTHCCATTCGFRAPKFPKSQIASDKHIFIVRRRKYNESLKPTSIVKEMPFNTI